MATEKREVPFKGAYWWSDSQNVTRILEKTLKEVLSETRVSEIEIRGSDFDDGRQHHTVKIEIRDNKVHITKIRT